VRKEAKIEFRIVDAEGNKVKKGIVAWGCKLSETKRGPKLRQKGKAGLFVNTL
jgi:hypothetical protein